VELKQEPQEKQRTEIWPRKYSVTGDLAFKLTPTLIFTIETVSVGYRHRRVYGNVRRKENREKGEYWGQIR